GRVTKRQRGIYTRMSHNATSSVIEKQQGRQRVQEKGEELVKGAYKAARPAGQTVKNALHGVWLRHPLHAALTDVPVGSWTAAVARDVLEARGQAQYAAGADAAIGVGLAGAVAS